MQCVRTHAASSHEIEQRRVYGYLRTDLFRWCSTGNCCRHGSLTILGGADLVAPLKSQSSVYIFLDQDVGCVSLVVTKEGRQKLSGLSNQEHQPTTSAASKHLRRHASTYKKSGVLDEVREIVKDAAQNEDTTMEEVPLSVNGAVAAVMRFQGILMPDREDLAQCQERIFKKVTNLLNSKQWWYS